MVTLLIGDLFASTAQTLVNTVNCIGVMGKGVALEFKKRYPEMYRDYVGRCGRGEVRLGVPYLYQPLVSPWIVNFPTKDHWRSVSRLSDIVAGLEYLIHHYRGWGITSLAVPPLGCGQGQLDWRVVGPTLYAYLSRIDVPVELYAPHGTPREQIRLDFLAEASGDRSKSNPEPPAPRIDPTLVALVEIVARVVREPYHWPIGRTTFQKIAYFATVAGIPTALQFAKGNYGPFAAELKPAIAKLVNNGLLEERATGAMLEVNPGPTYADAARSYGAALQQWESAIDRVSDLFLRIQTTRQAEVVATAHFAAKMRAAARGTSPSEIAVLNEVQQWKQRRTPPLAEADIVSAIRNLAALGWLDLPPNEGLIPDEALDLEPAL